MSRGARTAVAYSITALVLLLAMWVPSLFAPNVKDEPLTNAERVSMFCDYFNKRDPGMQVSEQSVPVSSLSSYLGNSVTILDTMIEPMISALLLEPGSAADGNRRAILCEITDDYGRASRVLRLFSEWEIDWHNWLDLCIDIDTGELYYMYISSRCLNNRENYTADRIDRPSTPAEAVTLWSTFTGQQSVSLDWSGTIGDTAFAVFSSDSEQIEYVVDCKFYPYTPGLFDGLFDFKFIVTDN